MITNIYNDFWESSDTEDKILIYKTVILNFNVMYYIINQIIVKQHYCFSVLLISLGKHI